MPLNRLSLLFLLISKLIWSQNLVVNEMAVSHFNHFQEGGEHMAWIELFNQSSESIDLSQYHLSNHIDSSELWPLPKLILPAKTYYTVYAQHQNTPQTEPMVNFELNPKGGHLFLFNQKGVISSHFSYPEIPTNTSFGRWPDGEDQGYYFSPPSFNAANEQQHAYSCVSQAPNIPLASGFYPEGQNIEMFTEDITAVIRYTLDGQTPEYKDAVYTSPLNLTRITKTNNFSNIPSNPSFDYPKGLYTELRANTRGWLAPYDTVPKIYQLSVKAFKDGCLPSKTIYRSYFLENEHPVDFPILCLAVDSLDLFSEEQGIYVYGKTPGGNYTGRGLAWERPAFVEYFNQGLSQFAEYTGLRLNGNGSRHSTMKNLRLHARSLYGNREINQALFQGYDEDEFKHLLIRSGGHRPDCIPRDDLANDLVDALIFDKAEYTHNITYINGEYWGIHALKEKLDEEYLSRKYDLKDEEIVIADYKGSIEHGQASDSIHYENMVQYALNQDLNQAQHYHYINTQMDIDNYVDYMVGEIFVGNADWTYSNIRFWRKRVPFNPNANAYHDGRWRWLFYDLDGAFGGSCDNAFVLFNTLEQALSTQNQFVRHTRLFRALCESEKFKDAFVLRMLDLLNSSFKPMVTRQKLKNIKDRLDPLMLEHVKRWRYPSSSSTLEERQSEAASTDQWEFLCQKLDSFLLLRPDQVRKQMQRQWNLDDSLQLELQVNNANAGYVQLNSIPINEHLEGVNHPVYPWHGVYFNNLAIPARAIANPGYRFVEWAGTGIQNPDTTFAFNGDTVLRAIFEVDPNYEGTLDIVINEVQSNNNSTIADQFGEYDDWVELYNPNDNPILLNGYYLSDDPKKPRKFRIENSEDVVIEAKSWKLIWCDNNPGQGALHSNFKLNGLGDKLYLTQPNGLRIIDSVQIPFLQNNFSYGRVRDGDPTWIRFHIPSANESNQSSEQNQTEVSKNWHVFPVPAKKRVYINEKVNAKIYNLQGQFLFRIKQENQFSVEHLEPGPYILQLENGESFRFLKE